ncbi:hypothetical protein LBBP_00967 [Leptospira borgpetersenii serovar Ballum]|uniref:Uncharacterized protein n=1 Tax=Leptospira borgpetersenii serovar Ballum TaxID=280505 RepID=A0A0S2INM9_LEPBO|nr:hypothetical protein LBBP_00967 [Leptospira borgpetersenii serovar Ballum]
MVRDGEFTENVLFLNDIYVISFLSKLWRHSCSGPSSA